MLTRLSTTRINISKFFFSNIVTEASCPPGVNTRESLQNYFKILKDARQDKDTMNYLNFKRKWHDMSTFSNYKYIFFT